MPRRTAIHRGLGEEMRAARKLLGLSQERLALESGVKRRIVSQIECGNGNPTITTLYKLAGALGVSGALLLAWAEDHAQSREAPATGGEH